MYISRFASAINQKLEIIHFLQARNVNQMKTSWFQNDQIRAPTRVTSWNTGRPNENLCMARTGHDVSRVRRASGTAAVPSWHGIELRPVRLSWRRRLCLAQLMNETQKSQTDYIADHCLISVLAPEAKLHSVESLASGSFAKSCSIILRRSMLTLHNITKEQGWYILCTTSVSKRIKFYNQSTS